MHTAEGPAEQSEQPTPPLAPPQPTTAPPSPPAWSGRRAGRTQRVCGGIKETENEGELAWRSCRMRFKQRIRPPAASFRRLQHLLAVGQSAGASCGKCPRVDGTLRRVTSNRLPHVSLLLAWREPPTAGPRAAAATRARAHSVVAGCVPLGTWAPKGKPPRLPRGAWWPRVTKRGFLRGTVGGARSGGGARFEFLDWWRALLRFVVLRNFVGRLAIGW